MTATRTGTRIRRQLWQLRRTGDSPAVQHCWGCRLTFGPDEASARIDAPTIAIDTGLDALASDLHQALLQRLPRALHNQARSEVGAVHTEISQPDGGSSTVAQRYALATCANVVIALTDDLAAVLTTPWRGTCAPAELDGALPLVLGSSAVLALTAGVLELPSGSAGDLPEWLSVAPVGRSPYPPHDCPSARLERWLRPMYTTRASRGEYRVRAALPTTPIPSLAVWVESLVSMDTVGRCWLAWLSLAHDGGRWWLPQPVPVEISARDLLRTVVGQGQSPGVAIDRDPIDGEAFGIAPVLCTDRTLGGLSPGGGG